MNFKFIWDIPCFFTDPEYLDAIEKVLKQIANRCPKDFRRLQRIVRAMAPHDEVEDGTCGSCIHASPNPQDRTTRNYDLEDAPCVILLVKDKPVEHLQALIAHELGHAAARLEDLWRRGAADTEEWRRELTADWYAYKWGFGRQIAKQRKTRDWTHHGATPGNDYWVSAEGKTYHFRISRNFVVHLVEVTDTEESESESTESQV